MKNKLTGWFRIGIFISALWVLSITGILSYQFIIAHNSKPIGYFISMKNCTTGEISKLTKAEAIELANLEYEKYKSSLKMPDKMTDTEMSNLGKQLLQKDSLFTKSIINLNNANFIPVILLKNYLLFCLLPLFCGWIIFYFLYFSIRWIIRGFKHH